MLSSLDTLLFLLIASSLIAVACSWAICILLIKWRGRSAGIVLGAIVLIVGISMLVLLTATISRYWWIAIPPIALGVQSIRVWARERSPTRLTLGSLLFAVGVVGVMCGGLGGLYRQIRIEQPIVEELQASIDCDIQRDFDGVVTGMVSYDTKVEQLEVSLLNAAKLRCLQRLQIGSGPLSHTHAKLIGDIGSLRQVWLQRTNFDDAMLRELARLKRLETLDLMQTDVTGAGLKYLYGSANLTHLWIDGDKISSSDVDQLRNRLPNLEVSH
jgi:hypothetical protein